MPDLSELPSRPGIEATFLPARTARHGQLALWHPTDDLAEVAELTGRVGPLEVVLPAGSGVRQRTVAAVAVSVDEAIDLLLHPDAARATTSVAAWSTLVRSALSMIARGLLVPVVDEDGIDGWRIGPLDAEHLAWRDALADALPPAGHATPIAGSAPRRVASPRWLAARWWDAVADAHVRTAAAPLAAGHAAFAARERTVLVDHDRSPRLDPPAAPRAAVLSGASAVPAARALGTDLAVATWGAATTGTPAWSAATAIATVRISLRLEVVADGTPADLDAADLRAVIEVASAADPTLVLDAAELWQAAGPIAERFGPHPLDAVLLELRRGARAWPPLARLLDAPAPATLALSDRDLDDLLGPTAEALAAAGIEVRWPAELLEPLDLRAVVSADTMGSDRSGALGLDVVGELRWEALLGDDALDADELDALVAAKRAVLRLRGRLVRADAKRLSQLQRRRDLRPGEALAAALTGRATVAGEDVPAHIDGPLAELADRLRDHAPVDHGAWSPPPGLRAELRPYQRTGVAWLEEMAALGVGGVLADDMGLGKTLQLLALHVARHERPERNEHRSADRAPTLVVCPVSVLSNWAREAARFTPEVPVVRFHGAQRGLEDLADDALVLTTYGVARREARRLASIRWGLLVADEAQALKNPRSRTARALRTIPGQARFALTGTPVENRLVDLWALLDWTTPGLLGPLERFRREVAVPVERDADEAAAEQLRALVAPFLLRRRKVDPDIVPDLPPKTEVDRVVPLTTEQATLYRATVEEVMAQVEAAEGMGRRGAVLKLLTQLKQVCDHPALLLPADGPLGGRSGKLDAVTELLDTIHAEGDAALVFTQYVAMGHLLQRHLDRPDRRVGFLHGGTSVTRRQELIDQLQAGALPVLVISVKAGGTGINLTQATHVVHYDRWWNPAVEDQASDRAWRIGQDRPVQVHRMVCEGTIEDRIGELLERKRALADAVVGSGEAWVSELDDQQLRQLVALDAAPDEGGAW